MSAELLSAMTATASGPARAVAQAAVPKATTFVGLIKHFFTAISKSTHGKLLLTIWGSTPFLAVIMYWKKRRDQRREREAAAKEKKLREERRRAAGSNSAGSGDEERENDSEEEEKKKKKKENPRPKDFWMKLKTLIRILVPSLLSKQGLYLGIYTLVLCSRVLITIKIADLVGSLGSLMGQRDFTAMFLTQARFSLWCFPAAIANSLMKFFEKRIALSFRSQLTDYIHQKYLSRRTFYQMVNRSELTNLDQRITSDVELFCKSLTFIYGHLLKPTLDVLFLSHQLTNLMGAGNLGAFFLYYFGINQVITAIKPSFSRMVMKKQELEGKFRADHARVVHFSEEIAFVEGAKRESVLCDRTFNKLKSHISDTLMTHLWTDVVDSYTMKYGGLMMAYTAIIPSVYLDWKKMTSHQATQHYLVSSTLLASLGNALKDIALSYKEVAKMQGLASRVYDLVKEVETISSVEAETDSQRLRISGSSDKEAAALISSQTGGVVLREKDTDVVVLRDVDIYTPDGISLLIRDLSLTIKPGEHLLVSGMNGTGKSSLFRTMGELWSLRKGIMRLPPKESVYFISQNAYMCPGNLRDQITYPQHIPFGDKERDEELNAELRTLLSMVDLDSLLERYDFDSEDNWNILSGGERQRLVIARLYFHKPRFGILDECTSAISVEMEHRIFEQCDKIGITMLTIAHNDALRRHHKQVLTFLGAGKWRLDRI